MLKCLLLVVCEEKATSIKKLWNEVKSLYSEVDEADYTNSIKYNQQAQVVTL